MCPGPGAISGATKPGRGLRDPTPQPDLARRGMPRVSLLPAAPSPEVQDLHPKSSFAHVYSSGSSLSAGGTRTFYTMIKRAVPQNLCRRAREPRGPLPPERKSLGSRPRAPKSKLGTPKSAPRTTGGDRGLPVAGLPGSVPCGQRVPGTGRRGSQSAGHTDTFTAKSGTRSTKGHLTFWGK